METGNGARTLKVPRLQVDGGGLSEISARMLVLCAVLTTILVVRREFVPGSLPSATTNAEWKALYVDGWQEALPVGIRSGSADAPVQVVAFEDFQCPYCARFDATVQAIRAKYPNKVAFTFAPFPLPYHDFAEAAGRVAECAHIQGRFDAMRSLLFEKQWTFGSAPWTELAMQVGIEDLSRFDACVNATDPIQRIEQSVRLADKLGIRGTPTVIVNGWKWPVAPSSEDFDKIVKNIMEGRVPGADIDFLATSAQN